MARTPTAGRRPVRAARNSFPIARQLLAAAGVIVPPRVSISGNFRSTRGVLLDTDRVTIAPGTTLVPHGRTAFLMSGLGVKGSFSCECSSGSGSCGISTFDDSGNPGMVCTRSGGCTGCRIRVSIPGSQLAPLVLLALGVRVERGATAIGDITRGALITSGGVRIARDSPISVVKDKDRALMIGGAGGAIQGEFNCSCKLGLCQLDIRNNGFICATLGVCVGGCRLVIRTPGLQLSMQGQIMA